MASQSSAACGPILLITDLSSRCDRALDRAVSLAQHHKVKLIALHVIEPSFLSRLILPAWNTAQKQHQEMARQRLTEDLKGADVDLEVLVEIGYPIDVITQVSKDRQCALIVSGTARDESLGRIMIGSTVERVARESEIPLLVVRNRPDPVYRHVLAGTDFSDSARNALQTAAALIPHDVMTVFHSFDEVAGSRDLDKATIEERKQFLTQQAETFVAQTPGLDAADLPATIVEYGAPGQTIPKFVQDHHVGLVVLGTHGASGILKTAMGSIAEQLLMLLRCDVMIVRAHKK